MEAEAGSSSYSDWGEHHGSGKEGREMAVARELSFNFELHALSLCILRSFASDPGDR